MATKFDFSQKENHFIFEFMRQAMPLARKIQNEMRGKSLTKNDRSPVTVADFSIQAIFGKMLMDQFPADILVGEESSDALRSEAEKTNLGLVTDYVKQVIPGATSESVCAWIDSGKFKPAKRFWTLDPIDGTSGFLRSEQYVIALALIENGRVELGALGCPNLNKNCEPVFGSDGTVIIAMRGSGAWINDLFSSNGFVRLSASKVTESPSATLLGSVEKHHTDQNLIDRLTQKLGVSKPALLMDSQAKYASLAGGIGDFFLYPLLPKRPEYRMKIWDVAPGAIVVEEAGGMLSDLNGNPLDFSCGLTMAKNPGLLITNGHLHEKVLGALKAIG